MEHRLFSRTNVMVEVVIYYCGQVTVRGKIRNLSRDGMFIETAAMFYPDHIPVEVGFVTHRNGMADEQRVRAYVIHRSNEGIGLMFVMLNEEDFRSINGLSGERSRCEVNTAAHSIESVGLV